MTQQEQNKAPIPTGLLVILSAVGFLIAFSNLLIGQQLSVIGFAGLGIGILSLLAAVVFDRQAFINALRGRTVTFGGTALVVLALVVIASSTVYIAVREQGWRADLSASEIFSLTEDSRSLVRTIAADPNTPQIKIIGYLGAAQGGTRDRTAVLLDDYVAAGDGKITYEFIDPNRNPLALETYGAQPEQLVVTALDENGEPITETAELVSTADQTVINDALVRLAARGDFTAYVLNLEGSAPIDDSGPAGASILAENLRTQFGWDVQSISAFDLLNEDNPLDNAGDGSVLVMLGGSNELPEDVTNAITEHLDSGGSLAIFAGINVEDGVAAASTPALSDYLWENFGLRVQNNIVFDPPNAAQSPFRLVEANFGTHYATRNLDAQFDALLFEATHSIEVADELPENVTVTPIVTTSEQAYTKTGLDLGGQLSEADIVQTEDDPTGSFVLGAAAENTETGARVIAYGSDSLIFNQYQQFQVAGVRNLFIARESLLWGANAEAFFENLPDVNDTTSPVEQPLLATDQQLATLTYFSVLLLPFGVLFVGVYMWWSRRQRSTA